MRPDATPFVPVWKTAPFIRWIVPLIVGIIISRYVELPFNGVLTAFCICALGFSLLYFFAFRFPAWYAFFFLGFWCSLGAMVYTLNRQERHPDFIGKHYREGLLMSATLKTVPEPTAKTWRVEAELRARDTLTGKWQPLHGRVLLYIEKDSTMSPLTTGNVIAFF